MEHPRQPSVPAGRPHTPSTKRTTCNFWARGDCRYSEEECMFAHAWVDLTAGQQELRRPSLPGWNGGRSDFGAGSHGSFHSYPPAPLAAPLLVSVSTTNASTHASAAIFPPAFTNSSVPAVLPAFPRASNYASAPTHLHSSMLRTSQEGQHFNPAAVSFEPSSAVDPSREQRKADALLKLVQQQAAAIASLYGDLENVATSLHFAAKDINDVATAMKDGPSGVSTNNVKKLTYRATDIEGVLRKQGEWKRTLQESMLETEAGLKEIGKA